MHPKRNFPDIMREHVNRIIYETATEHGVLLSDIIVGKKCRRDASTVAARAAAVWRVRDSVIQHWDRRGRKRISYQVENGDVPDGWCHASSTTLATLFNVDHSAIVLLLARTVGTAESEPPLEETQATKEEPNDGRMD